MVGLDGIEPTTSQLCGDLFPIVKMQDLFVISHGNAVRSPTETAPMHVSSLGIFHAKNNAEKVQRNFRHLWQTQVAASILEPKIRAFVRSGIPPFGKRLHTFGTGFHSRKDVSLASFPVAGQKPC
jgi:hypothetical protein